MSFQTAITEAINMATTPCLSNPCGINAGRSQAPSNDEVLQIDLSRLKVGQSHALSQWWRMGDFRTGLVG
eukprot:symbB.v1.2.034385.t1/scaffold4428.1/size42469/3